MAMDDNVFSSPVDCESRSVWVLEYGSRPTYQDDLVPAIASAHADSMRFLAQPVKFPKRL